MILTFPTPDPLDGALLLRQCEDAGLEGLGFSVEGATLTVEGVVPEQEQTLRDIVGAHAAIVSAALATQQTYASNDTTLRSQAETALAANKTYVAIASPTNAQVVAQVKALTRQNNGLIRLVLNKLDATD